MVGYISENAALMFHYLNVDRQTEQYYVFGANELDGINFNNLDSTKISDHPISNGPIRDGGIHIPRYTYAEAIDIFKDVFDVYISVSPYRTYSTARGYAYAATAYDLQQKCREDNILKYPIYTAMYIDECMCLNDVITALLSEFVRNGRRHFPYILWLDDLRIPDESPWKEKISNPNDVDIEWCRTRSEFCQVITKRGMPTAIYFDHDLGDPDIKESGYGCAKWLIDYMIDYNIDPTDTQFFSQSDNQPGKENILSLIDNYKKFYKEQHGI